MAAERWESIRRRVVEIGRASVRAGVVGEKARETHPESGLTNAELGLLHEIGNEDQGGNLKRRSFVGSTVADPAVQAEFTALQARMIKEVLLGRMGRDEALAVLGAFMAEKIKYRIESGEIRPEDAPATVAAKGHDTVLVGTTGKLAEAIGWEIEK